MTLFSPLPTACCRSRAQDDLSFVPLLTAICLTISKKPLREIPVENCNGETELNSEDARLHETTTMPKFEINSSPELSSVFLERRRLRRIRMIVELTLNLISSDQTASHREARCLVECARKAILELHPTFADRYERVVRPHFERVLGNRWPFEEAATGTGSDLVN